MLGHRPLSAADFPEIWRRRRKWALACLLLGLAAGYALARSLPARYTSTAAIQVTRIPGADTGTMEAEEISDSQLSTLEGQVLTRDRLQSLRGLVEPVAGHPPDKSVASTEDPLAEIRRNIVLRPAARGFTVSFTAGDAGVAREVCATIAMLFTQASATDQPQSTDAFLNDQIADAKDKLDAQESKLAAFQRRHGVQPSTDNDVETQNSLMGYNVQLEAANGALQRALQERTSLTESIRTIESAASQVRPAVEPPNVQALEQEMATEQAQLVTLEARYTPDHPDVVKLRTDLARLQKKIEEAKTAAAPKKSAAAPAAEPPQAAQLRAQVQELDRTIQKNTAEQIRLQGEIRTARTRLENSAALERERKKLTLDRDAAQTSYNTLLANHSKIMKARQLEGGRDRSAFRVLAAANLPATPSFPNPILFALGGAGGGLGVGLLVVALGELRDKTLRTEGDIEHYLELPTLAVIPTAGGPGRKDSAGRGGARAVRSAHAEKEESILADV
jgi:protein tyrosine kinase modulator